MQVFDDVVRKSRLIRTAMFFYDNAPAFIKSYLLILYGLKCYLSARVLGPTDSDILYFGSTPNERGAVARLKKHLHGLSGSDVRLSKMNCFHPAAVLALPAFIFLLPRLYKLSRRLNGKLHFMPACRVLSTVTYYLRFRILMARSGARTIFIANHYSPECIALAVAAHALGRKVCCTNHANGTWSTGYVPPLHCDLVAVTSSAILEAYTKASGRQLNAVFLPQAVPHAPMRRIVSAEKPVTVGIYLTALTSMPRLHELVRQLAANSSVEKILIRSHPVRVVNEDLSELTAAGERIEDTSQIALPDNIALCDLAICGNSSASVDVLRGGVPVLYDHRLDELPFDGNGYLRRGLIMSLPATLDAGALASVRNFYGSPSWPQTMRHFDAGYGQDDVALLQTLNDAVRQLIGTVEQADLRRPSGDPSLVLGAQAVAR